MTPLSTGGRFAGDQTAIEASNYSGSLGSEAISFVSCCRWASSAASCVRIETNISLAVDETLVSTTSRRSARSSNSANAASSVVGEWRGSCDFREEVERTVMGCQLFMVLRYCLSEFEAWLLSGSCVGRFGHFTGHEVTLEATEQQASTLGDGAAATVAVTAGSDVYLGECFDVFTGRET